MFSNIKNFFRRLFGRHTPKHYSYDHETDDKGNLTPDGHRDWKNMRTAEMREGDTYELGTEATVHVGPSGKAGKAWVKARVAASKKRRAEKYAAWWEAKRNRCMQLMLMSEQELKDAGVYDEVQQFLAESRAKGLEVEAMLKKAAELREGKIQPEVLAGPQPSGRATDRFADMLQDTGLLKDGKLVEATDEALAKYAAVAGKNKL